MLSKLLDFDTFYLIAFVVTRADILCAITKEDFSVVVIKC